jgi:hypothetical protein
MNIVLSSQVLSPGGWSSPRSWFWAPRGAGNWRLDQLEMTRPTRSAEG